MAIRYSKDGVNEQIKLNHITVFPGRRQLVMWFDVIDLDTMVVRQESIMVTGEAFDALDTITAADGDRLGRCVVDECYAYMVEHHIDDIIKRRTSSAQYERPELEII